ncbi:UNVERIFIED_CONTAM: hypothetical protein NCL1_37205 [Trichonephila clavipes]
MSHSNPAQVGEIFTAAGAAFNKLAELIMNMHAANELTSTRAESTEAKDICLPQKTSHVEVENISELLKNMNRKVCFANQAMISKQQKHSYQFYL